MDQQKIGLFLKELRKQKQLTQSQFAEMLGVSNRTVSRWETGTNMPDFDVLIEIADFYEIDIREILEGQRRESVDISINESSKGEEIENKNTERLSVEALRDYSKYIKRKEKRKIALLLGVTLVILIFSISTMILLLNKTFFKTMYSADFVSDVDIPIPEYSYYRGTGGLDQYTTRLKTLKEPDEVNVFIDNYLQSLEKVEYNNEIYYYDQENDFTILNYRINNDGVGFINTIYITYQKGKICD